MNKATSDTVPRKRTKIIRRRWANKTLVVGPVQPVDGDSLSCVKAMIIQLRKIGKEAYTLPTTSMYPQLNWIIEHEDIHPACLPLATDNLTTSNLQHAYDTMCAQWLPDEIVVVDGQADRLGFNRGNVRVYTIDHHLDKGAFDNKSAFVQKASSAACLLIKHYRILEPILAAGILTDTFGLRHNMPAQAIDSLAMLRKGRRLTDELLMEYQEKLTVPKHEDILWEIRNCQMRKKGNAILAILNDSRPEIHRAVISELMSYPYQHFCVVRGDGYVSLRSTRTNINLRQIASKQGGGGHLSMAAAQLSLPLNLDVIEQIWQEFLEEVGVTPTEQKGAMDTEPQAFKGD